MPTPLAVVSLMADAGTVAGQQLVLLSLEVYDDWADLRFARIDVGAARPLARRVPSADAWTITSRDGQQIDVIDCVGRGDRHFSNGEARLQPVPRPGATLDITVALVPGDQICSAEVSLHDWSVGD